MTQTYQSGIYCRDIGCGHHAQLEKFTGDEYMRYKTEYCRECRAWQFLNWLTRSNWKITLCAPEVSPKALAARIKGLSPSAAADLTEEDILCL